MQDVDSTLIGGQLLDAANPAGGVVPDACAICGTNSNLRRTSVPGPSGVVCLPHLDSALRTLGPATVDSIGICSAEHGYDPMQARYGVVAVWPLSTYRDVRQPSIRACLEHLAAAIAGLAADSP